MKLGLNFFKCIQLLHKIYKFQNYNLSTIQRNLWILLHLDTLHIYLHRQSNIIGQQYEKLETMSFLLIWEIYYI